MKDQLHIMVTITYDHHEFKEVVGVFSSREKGVDHYNNMETELPLRIRTDYKIENPYSKDVDLVLLVPVILDEEL